MESTLRCVVLALGCAIFCNVNGNDVGAKVNANSFDFVMKELMKQRLDIEKQQTELEKLRLENVALNVKLSNSEKELGKQAAQLEKFIDTLKTRGSNYVRWGRTICEGEATLLYKGYTAGAKHTDKGAGANYLCIHEQPQWSRYLAGVNHYASSIYGVEYEMYEGITNVFSYANNGGHQLRDHPAPCSVCYTPKRSTTVMIPARTECPAGWDKEYQGYIVSDHHLHHRREYICWDQAPETATATSSLNQGLIYPVEVMCGSLPCSRFPDGLELTCVVCSK